MKTDNFLSLDKYVALPTKANPKVLLAVSNRRISKTSFELYTPFSFKTKVLKAIAKFLFINCNTIFKKLLLKKTEKSVFINFLENELDYKDLTCSLYLATDKDKVVLQLQDTKGVVGYVKYALNSNGQEKLLNEKKGIEILSKMNLVPKLISEGSYENKPYIILKKLEGDVSVFDSEQYQVILNTLKKDTYYKLNNHPRALKLKEDLHKAGFNELESKLDLLLKTSKQDYLEVYEHGDFAPWNLIQTGEGLMPFDFEYFTENGLEYMDKLKYHFQIQNLLYNKKGLDLVQALSKKVPINEFTIIFNIFLLKEIYNKFHYEESFEFEKELLTQVEEFSVKASL